MPRKDNSLKIGSLVMTPMDGRIPPYTYGIVISFDEENDPIVCWTSGEVEAEYIEDVTLLR